MAIVRLSSVLLITIVMVAESAVAAAPVLGADFEIDTPIYAPMDGSLMGVRSAAWNGTNFLTAWSFRDSDLGCDECLYVTRVNANGTVLDPLGIQITKNAGGGAFFGPAGIASDGKNFLVVWDEEGKVYGKRVSNEGTVLDASPIALSQAPGGQYLPVIAWNGTHYFVAWLDSPEGPGTTKVWGTRVTAAGVPLDKAGILISSSELRKDAPALASNGSGWLVAWKSWYIDITSADILAARIGADGKLLDATPLVLTKDDKLQTDPTVASDGNNYLVAWEHAEFVNPGYRHDVFAKRVSADGAIVDSKPISIYGDPSGLSSHPQLTWTGSNYMAIWATTKGNAAARLGARVSAAGSVIDATPKSFGDGYTDAVAWTGSQFLVAWRKATTPGYASIFASRFDIDGKLLGTAQTLISGTVNHQSQPSIAWNGSHFFVVWTDFRDGNSDIYGARVSRNGVPFDKQAIAIATAAEIQSAPRVASDGQDFMVVWSGENPTTKDYDIYASRVTSTGAVLDMPAFQVVAASESQRTPTIAWSGTDYLVVWVDNRNAATTGNDLYGARITKIGWVMDVGGFEISKDTRLELSPRLDWNGTNYLLIWTDSQTQPGGTFRVRGSRLSPQGTRLDTTAFTLSETAFAAPSPSIAWNGVNHLVVWADARKFSTLGSDIYGARIAINGGILDIAGLPISTAADYQTMPVTSWDGKNFFVAWTNNQLASDIQASSMTPSSGTTIDNPVLTIAAEPRTQESPAVQCVDGACLTVWTTPPANPTTLVSRLRSRLVTLHGAPVATPQTIDTPQNTAATITLEGTDPDGDALTFTVVTQPNKGKLSGSGTKLTYLPNTEILGADEFTFKVNDGAFDSAPAKVSINVTSGTAGTGGGAAGTGGAGGGNATGGGSGANTGGGTAMGTGGNSNNDPAKGGCGCQSASSEIALCLLTLLTVLRRRSGSKPRLPFDVSN